MLLLLLVRIIGYYEYEFIYLDKVMNIFYYNSRLF